MSILFGNDAQPTTPTGRDVWYGTNGASRPSLPGQSTSSVAVGGTATGAEGWGEQVTVDVALAMEMLDAYGDVPPRAWERRHVGRALVDCVTFDQAVSAVLSLALDPLSRRYVVTPNIQHVVALERNTAFRDAYAGADLVLPDGAPVAAALRAASSAPQTRVTGADLMPAVCAAAAERGLTVGILGGARGSAEAAAAVLRETYPALRVVLVEPAPYGFIDDPAQLDAVLDHVAVKDPDILFVALGAPKQEVFVHAYRTRLGTGVALCVGAAVDFLAGHIRRAPHSWQRVGMEWAWRVVQEPRRLARRYLAAAPVFLWLVLPMLLTALVRTSPAGSGRGYARGRAASPPAPRGTRRAAPAGTGSARR